MEVLSFNMEFILDLVLGIVSDRVFGKQCDKCLKYFSSNSNLKKHRKLINKMPPLQFELFLFFYIPTFSIRGIILCITFDFSFEKFNTFRRVGNVTVKLASEWNVL